MTKDVLVSISGLHIDPLAEPQEDSEAIEVVTPASYFFRNGKHYILYDEVQEEIPGIIKNKIKITGNDCLEIMKTGVTNSHMIFEHNKKNLTYYETPYGKMLVGVNTKSLEVTETENHISVRVEYELDVNHEPLAECKINMNIASKTGGAFSVL